MIAEQYPRLLERSAGEKLQLAGELWRDVIRNEIVSDDPAVVTLIESRLAEYQANPDRVSTWDEVKARLMALRP